VANAQHIKTVPGRKTDVQDAEWIAELLQHGLLTASFVPGQEHQELRELTRLRVSLVQERARLVNRVRHPCLKRLASTWARFEALSWGSQVAPFCMRSVRESALQCAWLSSFTVTFKPNTSSWLLP
jgi:transposase